MVRSLSTSLSIMVPQCPCVVYSQLQTSAITKSLSSNTFFNSEIALGTILLELQEISPVSSFLLGIPNTIIEFILL